tara:strand:- start:1077 stop:1592 length:516 start_codon:yes stop_codon:yes gene_type:complete
LNISINTDTSIVSFIPQVNILSFKDYKERRKYYILKRRILKVYPFAIEAKNKIQEIENSLDTILKKRHKRRYVNKMSKWVKEEYSVQLKKLTMSEGRILVKLVYRETNLTTYEILKNYRGGFNAFFWQSLARIYENNLKSIYDPINVIEDKMIEQILLDLIRKGKFKNSLD